MSVNIGAQQLSSIDVATSCMEPSSDSQNNMPPNLVGQQLSSVNKQSAQVDMLPSIQSRIPDYFELQHLSDNHHGLVRGQLPIPVNLGAYPLQSMPMAPHFNLQTPMSTYLGLRQLSPTVRRPSGVLQSLKVETSMPTNKGSQPLSSTSKRSSPMGASSKARATMLLNSTPQQMSGTKRPHVQPPHNIKTETFDLLRSKLRENLTSALCTVAQQQIKKEVVEKSSSDTTDAQLQKQENVASQEQSLIEVVSQSTPTDTSNSQKQAEVNAISDEMLSDTAHGPSQELAPETLTSIADKKHSEFEDLPSSACPNEKSGDQTMPLKCNTEEYQITNVSSDDDLPFSINSTIKDDFLQGHGLCWAPEVDVEYTEAVQSHSAKKTKLDLEEITKGTEDRTLLTAQSEAMQNPSAKVLKWEFEEITKDSENTTLSNAEKESLHNPSAKELKLELEEVTKDTEDTTLRNAEKLAIQIEAEMFKYFGGVNKKYKEKGRSLLFNLKDRSNPELRERVLSGDIVPERLCSMTAEELASKELSEWRLAKAEEYSQMVVLQDSEVDIRRLVRKTHKGEFQVEVEHDDNISAEVAHVADIIVQVPRKSEEVQAQQILNEEDHTSSMSNRTKATEGLLRAKDGLSDQNLPGELDSHLHEKNDLIQDFMVDELKETENLPQVVSLDEFMQDLDKEPPFENLPMDTGPDSPDGKTFNVLDPEIKHGPEILDSENGTLPGRLDTIAHFATESSGSKVNGLQEILVGKNSDTNQERSFDTSSRKISDVKEKYPLTENDLKSVHGPRNSFTGDDSLKNGFIWEGTIQLNISAMATVVGSFRSGERTSAGEWSDFLEIKGRVRLDAFEKFLQELPLSRSRAIMIALFSWKEGSPADGRLHICEAANSYVTDDRVGFAEPASGVELYLCPPHPKTIEMLKKHLPEEHMVGLQSVSDGLIGIVVWRRPVTVSHHKHKKHSSSRKHQDVNPKLTPKSSMPRTPSNAEPTNARPPPENEPIDDIPPGFGPKDDDDLPEFDFVNSSKHATAPIHSQVPLRLAPAQQMRELIQKYGQSNNPRKSTLEIWNDDDDIPEWQPNQDIRPQTQRPTQPPIPQPPPIQQPQGYVQQHFIPNQNFMPQPPPQPQHVPPQQFMSLPIPQMPQMQMQMQLPMGMLPAQQNVLPGWQHVSYMPHVQAAVNVGFPYNNVMQPNIYPGQPAPPNGMIWRPDNPGGYR